MNVRRRWRVDGRVQGVGFRAFCEEAALARGIRGWVRNESDGSVLIEAEADVDALGEFLRYLRSAHISARIDRVEEYPLSAKKDMGETFCIR